ncbi:MAG: hypothetical protein K6T65_02980 [Peptococcaceae bacterium]|nr:hypothetical protein [Peptococcaceae bacterium]
MKKIGAVFASGIFLILLGGVLIPYLIISDGVSYLPYDKQEYGKAAIRSAYMVLDNPLQKFLVRKIKVKSLNMDDKTGKLEALVNVYTFWGIPCARIKMSGKANPEDIHNMGFTDVWIE